MPSGWSGSITPSKEGYSINPSSKNYSNVTQSIADNYLISKNTFTISGTVKSPILQNGIKNVKITGLAGEPLTDSSGYYSATIYQGWSGYVTIQKSGWYITNPSIIYNHINTNVTEQIIAGFLVKGIIYNSIGNPIKNAVLNGFPGGAIYSDSIGSYSKLLDSGWSGTVIPSFSGSTFNPNFRTYNNLSTSYYYHDYNEIPVMKVNLKVFLSGSYASGTDTMNCNIRRNSMLPQIPNINYSNKGNLFYYNLKSSDTVSQLFWNQNKKIVDWISIEILNTNNFSSVDTVPGLLRNDGRILSLNGDTLIRLDARVTSGNYYIVIRHRNHIAVMSKLPIYISTNTPLYDFTTGLDKYYGDDAKQLKPGLFGMYAGDANYDGIINEADFILYNNDSQNALSGYMICDFNIDGYVTSKDFNFIAPNMRKNISTNIPTITYSPK